MTCDSIILTLFACGDQNPRRRPAGACNLCSKSCLNSQGGAGVGGRRKGVLRLTTRRWLRSEFTGVVPLKIAHLFWPRSGVSRTRPPDGQRVTTAERARGPSGDPERGGVWGEPQRGVWGRSPPGLRELKRSQALWFSPFEFLIGGGISWLAWALGCKTSAVCRSWFLALCAALRGRALVD